MIYKYIHKNQTLFQQLATLVPEGMPSRLPQARRVKTPGSPAHAAALNAHWIRNVF